MASAAYAVATEAVEAWRAETPVRSMVTAYVEDAGRPALPQNPDPIDLDALAGAWSGSLGLYPRFFPWPATLELRISGGHHPHTSMRVSFGGSPPDIAYDRLPVSDEGAYVQFLDPDGPNGGFIRYRLAPVGDSLIGVGEFITDVDVYGLGSIRLQRR